MTFQNTSEDMILVSNWNQLYDEINRKDLLPIRINKSTRSSSFELFSAFLDTVAELNLLSKQVIISISLLYLYYKLQIMNVRLVSQHKSSHIVE